MTEKKRRYFLKDGTHESIKSNYIDNNIKKLIHQERRKKETERRKIKREEKLSNLSQEELNELKEKEKEKRQQEYQEKKKDELSMDYKKTKERIITLKGKIQKLDILIERCIDEKHIKEREELKNELFLAEENFKKIQFAKMTRDKDLKLIINAMKKTDDEFNQIANESKKKEQQKRMKELYENKDNVLLLN